jgi:hypothetical protein
MIGYTVRRAAPFTTLRDMEGVDIPEARRDYRPPIPFYPGGTLLRYDGYEVSWRFCAGVRRPLSLAKTLMVETSSTLWPRWRRMASNPSSTSAGTRTGSRSRSLTLRTI